MLHGEKVAFGTLVQLVLEDSPDNEIFTLIDFCRTVGLPTCLAMMGAKNISPERLMQVAVSSCEDDKPMGNMPFPVTPEDVLSAILVADKIGN
jgi:glycerol dehydrogenase